MSESETKGQYTNTALVEEYIGLRREASEMNLQAAVDLADFNNKHSSKIDKITDKASKGIPNWSKLSRERRLELIHDSAVKLDGGDPSEDKFIVQSF